MSLSVDSAIESVRVEVGKKRLRINDRFRDFDKLRSGEISADQFRRCLVGLNCALSNAQFKAIAEAFPGRSVNSINYGRFTAEVEREEVSPSLLTSLRSPPKELTNDAERLIAKFNDSVVQKVIVSGIDVLRLFKDFDKHNVGLVTEAQFERCFPVLVDSVVLQALKNKYRDGKGNILYYGWCQQIAEAVASADRSRSPPRKEPARDDGRHLSPSRFNNPPPNAPVSQLVATIRAQVAQHRLRCEDAFLDYDKTRTHTVTMGQFLSAMGRLKFVKFQLTMPHLESLANAYGRVDTSGVLRVNYVALLRDITPAPAVGEGQAAAGGDSNDLAGRTSDHLLPLAPLSPQDEAAALAVVDKVKKTVETCRINLKPALQDYDRAIKGLFQTRTCTKTRFQRALAINKLSLRPAEVELLCKRYAVLGADGQQSDDINYVAFCRDVEPPSLDVTTVATGHSLHGTSATSSPERQRGSTASPSSYKDVIRKIASLCATRCVRLSEFFKDFDPLRSGTVQNDKFASALGLSGLSLTDKELGLLFQEYASARVANHVEVARFLADVDRTGSSELVTIAAGSYSSGSLRSIIGGGSSSGNATAASSLSDDDIGVLRVVLERVSEHVKHHGLLLPPFFTDYDRHHTGRITKTQFGQTISRHRLPVSEKEHEVLCRAYADASSPDMILYRSFIGDVDDAENVSLQLANRSASRKPLPVKAASPSELSSAAHESTLHKIASFVQKKNCRLDEFFLDADPLRHRCIPSSRFRGALAIVGLSLSEPELANLEHVYHTDRTLNGVDYVAFASDVQRAAAALAAVRQSGAPETSSAAASSERAEGDAAFRTVLESIHKSFLSRRLSVRSMIQDFDKLRRGTVSEAQFLSCLTSCGVRLTQPDILAIRKNIGNGEGLIWYHKFCDAVDTSK